MAGEAVVDLRRISKRYGEIVALDDVSLAAEPGQVVALLGPSGCGKTTTLRIIAGFTEPDSGEVLIRGGNMRGVRPYERNIGLVFQDYALFPHMTVAQNVAYGLRQRGWGRNRLAARIAEMLRLVRLEGLEDRRPAGLSGGQQQRVALARALASSPELLLLDEPLSALDAKLRDELRSELKEILVLAGATTIVVTHDQEEAMSLAEHVIVMARGRVLQQGAPATIYSMPCCREVALFLGRANWFDGELGLALPDGLREFRCAEGRFAIIDRAPISSAAYGLCIRPERLVLLDALDDGDVINRLGGVVRDVVCLGAETHISIDLGSRRTVLLVRHDQGQVLPAQGSRVAVGFRPQDASLIPV